MQSLYSGGHQARSCTPPDAGQSSGAYYPNSPAAAMNLMRLRKGPIVGISKRISVPENFTYFAGGAVQPTLPQSQVLFQQRLMQQQQKRAAAVAGAAAPAAMAPAMRHRSGSWSSRHAANKYLQHQVGILIQGGRRHHVNVCLGASIYDVRKSFVFFNPPPLSL